MTGVGGLPCRKYFQGTDCGTVFKLRRTSTGWFKSTPYRFKGGSDGFAPWGPIVFDASGNLYGATSYGGVSSPPFGNGTVYELSPSAGGAWTETVLYKFNGVLSGVGGAYPTSGVIFDPAGNIFGLANAGGTGDSGTLFELTPNSSGQWTETTIVSFQGVGGASPEGQLVRDSSGNFYGTAPFGGAISTNCSGGCGVVFEVTP